MPVSCPPRPAPPLRPARRASGTFVEADLEALLDRDHGAFERLIRQESPRLLRIITRVVKDQDEARSVLQETFLQAYERIHTFRREAKVTTWLCAIAINLSYAALRKRRRYLPLHPSGDPRPRPGTGYPAEVRHEPHDTPQHAAERSERHRLVHDAIEQLPLSYRTVVVLRDLNELSTREAASALGISEGACRVRLHRARQAMRTLLDAYL